MVARLRSREVRVRVGPAVAVELPGVADLDDEVEVEVADDQLLVVGADPTSPTNWPRGSTK